MRYLSGLFVTQQITTSKHRRKMQERQHIDGSPLGFTDSELLVPHAESCRRLVEGMPRRSQFTVGQEGEVSIIACSVQCIATCTGVYGVVCRIDGNIAYRVPACHAYRYNAICRSGATGHLQGLGWRGYTDSFKPFPGILRNCIAAAYSNTIPRNYLIFTLRGIPRQWLRRSTFVDHTSRTFKECPAKSDRASPDGQCGCNHQVQDHDIPSV